VRILIVEDDAISRHCLQRFMCRQGHEVTAVSDGREAWDAMVEKSFEALLTDWRLPGLDGLELTRRVRGLRGAGMPVLLLTVVNDEEAVRSALASGVDAVIGKPYDPQEVETVLEHMTEVRSVH
jgi:DNA-binding response OmpR family regulator